MGAPLPVNFKGTPQAWFEQMLARMVLSGLPIGFVESDTMPTSNQGPWLKGGKEIWVWDEDTTTYVPQSLSYLTQQIWIGDKNTEPDHTKYQVWLKLDGTTFSKWSVWLGDFIGWVDQDNSIAPGSITTTELGKPCIYRDNIADGEVIASKIQNELPVNKLANGSAGQVLRTNADGATVNWETMIGAGTEHSWTNSSGDSYTESHGLGAIPKFVRCVLVCKTADIGYHVGDEVDIREAHINDGAHYTDGLVFRVTANSTSVSVGVTAGSTVWIGGSNPTTSRWKIKLYWAR